MTETVPEMGFGAACPTPLTPAPHRGAGEYGRTVGWKVCWELPRPPGLTFLFSDVIDSPAPRCAPFGTQVDERPQITAFLARVAATRFW